MPITILYLVVAFIYLAVAIDYWRNSKAQEKNLKLHTAIIALGLGLHGWLLYSEIFAQPINFGFYHALSLIFWLTVVIYWLVNFKHAIHGLQAFVLPPAAIFAMLSGLVDQNHFLPQTQTSLFLVHIGIAMLAYSLFTFAALHACLMSIAESDLHNKQSWIKLPEFPPILTMENLLFRVLWIGFFLLTITLASGMLFSEQIFGKPLQFSHKVVFSIASWLIYGWLLFGRYQYGWRGKKAIRWTLWGFGLLLLAYIGTSFVLQVILQR